MTTTSGFRSSDEFREVLNRLFGLMSADSEIGPRLRDADVPERFEFSDLELVLNVRGAREGEEGSLVWRWTDDVDWQPRVRMTMSSEVANRYFQGGENVPIAVARRRIKAAGDLGAAFSLIPILKSAFPHYRRLVEAEYPHLALDSDT